MSVPINKIVCIYFPLNIQPINLLSGNELELRRQHRSGRGLWYNKRRFVFYQTYTNYRVISLPLINPNMQNQQLQKSIIIQYFRSCLLEIKFGRLFIRLEHNTSTDTSIDYSWLLSRQKSLQKYTVYQYIHKNHLDIYQKCFQK